RPPDCCAAAISALIATTPKSANTICALRRNIGPPIDSYRIKVSEIVQGVWSRKKPKKAFAFGGLLHLAYAGLVRRVQLQNHETVDDFWHRSYCPRRVPSRVSRHHLHENGKSPRYLAPSRRPLIGRRPFPFLRSPGARSSRPGSF